MRNRLSLPSSLLHIARLDEPLWRHTSMRVGGPATIFARPESVADLRTCLDWAHKECVPVFFLGGGTNVICSDRGFEGLVIVAPSGEVQWEEDGEIHAPAGTSLSVLAWEASRRGWTGLEFACGIPGTVGGATVMNAGTKHGEVKDVVISLAVIERASGELRTFSVADLEYGYRTSCLRTGQAAVVVEAVFRPRKASAQESSLSRARAWQEERRLRMPQGASSGCIFRNPAGDTSAGELIDRAGCKRLRVGQATVSHLHANFILNTGFNNASDVLLLIERIKAEVHSRFGVELEEEVEIIA